MRQANDNPGTPKRSGGSGCDESHAFLHLAIEGELDRLRSAQLATHLETCADCRTLHTELLDEKRWLLENAVRSPRLREGFAADICAQLRAEGATPGDLSDPLETVAVQEEEAVQEVQAVETSPAPRRSAVGEALPWLSAAAVAIFLAYLGGMVESDKTLPATLVETARVDSAKTAAVDVASNVSAPVDTVVNGEPANGEPANGGVVERVIRSSDYCSLDAPPAHEPTFASFHCPSIDVFSEDEPASEADLAGTPLPRVIPAVSLVVQRVPLKNGRIDTTELALRAVKPSIAVQRSTTRRGETRHTPTQDELSGAMIQQGSQRTIGHVLVLTHRLASRQLSRKVTQRDDPCSDDTNKDGELDYRDVTHMCQVLMKPETAEAPGGFLAMGEVPTADDIDCEEDEDCI